MIIASSALSVLTVIISYTVKYKITTRCLVPVVICGTFSLPSCGNSLSSLSADPTKGDIPFEASLCLSSTFVLFSSNRNRSVSNYLQGNP